MPPIRNSFPFISSFRQNKRVRPFRFALLVLFSVTILLVPRASTAFASSLSWSTRASAPLARFEGQGLVVNNKLYLFGGFYNSSLLTTTRADVYSIASNSWSRIAGVPERLTHAAQVVDGNTIYLVGGYVGNNPGLSTNHVWKYSISNNSWSAGPALPSDRGGGAAVVLGRNLHFFGGATRRTTSKSSTIDRAEHYVLNLDGGKSWTTAKPLPNPRNHLGATVLNGKAYAIGGQHTYNEGTTNQKQVDVYNPATDSWSRAADLPLGRGHISASTFTMNGRIIIIGGTVNNGTSGSASAEVTSYNPDTNAWSRLTPLPSGRKTPIAGTDGTRIIVSTGGLSSATSTTWVSSTGFTTAASVDAAAVPITNSVAYSSQIAIDNLGQNAFVCDLFDTSNNDGSVARTANSID